MTLGEVELFFLQLEDVTEEYVSWLNDPAINQYLESRYAEHTLESTREFLAAVLSSDDSVLFGIRSLPSRAHIGNIKLGPINTRHQTAEIGILVGDRQCWGKGVATAAISILCNFASSQLALRKVTAGCYASNIGSRKAFQKAGFSVEGIRRSQMLLNGAPEDLILLGRVLRA